MNNKVIYSAINSTVFDYAINYPRILETMKQAEHSAYENEAEYHVISALALTGPNAQGYNRFINTKDDGLELLTLLSKLASEGSPKNSALTHLISFPWYHRDASKNTTHPFYDEKSSNRPFYATASISGGKITNIHLETHLEYHEGGPYDGRHFASWPMGLCENLQFNNNIISVGSIELGSDLAIASNLKQAKELINANSMIETIVINGPNDTVQRDIQSLSKSKPDCIFIACSPLGSDSGDNCGSGKASAYRNGELIYSTANSSLYSFSPSFTQVIPTNLNDFNEDLYNAEETIIKASALWLRDYLLKSQQQGFVISMSDQHRSVFTLMVANQCIDYAIDAYGGVKHFLDKTNFGHLACKSKIIECLSTQDELSAIRLLKHNLLACIYFPSPVKPDERMLATMQSLVESTGASFQISETRDIIKSNIKELKEGLANEQDKLSLDDIIKNYPDVIQAATERAQVTIAGITGNMENKICLSNASANAVAYGRLHAGGAGQEGPLSITLPLSERQILRCLYHMAKTSTMDELNRHLNIFSPNIETIALNENEELIIEELIIKKNSPLETYRLLKPIYTEEFGNTLSLLKAIDNACYQWSISQPARVALCVAPNLGRDGKNLDRYRAVRNSRDNQYFHNGRVELKLEYMNLNSSDIALIANSDKPLRDYLLETDFEQVDPNKVINLVTAYHESNTISLPIPLNVNQQNQPSLHVGVASLKQTMFDFSNNKKNIKFAIQKAINEGIDVLLTPELSLTGYFGDGDFDWIRNEEEGNKLFQHALDIARYAAKSNLVISIGLPVFIHGYQKPFVGQALLHQGKIISISLKMAQPDGKAEFEAMHFERYDINTMGPMRLQIQGQAEPIAVGKPVVIIADKNGYQVPIYQEQCAEAWPGVNDDGTIDIETQRAKRFLNQIATNYPGLLVLNPSGSKNEVGFNKTAVRQNGLGKMALESNPNLSAYVYGNVAGDDNGTVGGDADTFIVARNENTLTVHHGMRHTLGEHTLTSTVISIPQTKSLHTIKSPLLLVVANPSNSVFNPLGCTGNTNGKEALFDNLGLSENKQRQYTETTYAAASWVLNTLRHHKKQCFVISLSGGADSTLGAVHIVAAVDLFIDEHKLKAQAENPLLSDEMAKNIAIKQLLNTNFAHLNCKDEVLAELVNNGSTAAIKHIKKNILVCVYMPTANSSEDTLISAKTLIEGGRRYDLDENNRFIKPLRQTSDTVVEGIGGTFIECNLQEPMEEFINAYAGQSDNFNALISDDAMLNEINLQVDAWKEACPELNQYVTPESRIKKIVALYSERKLYDKEIVSTQLGRGESPTYVFPQKLLGLLRQTPPTWFEKSHDLAKQNMQPRLRSICPWLLAELYSGLPLYTSNLSEAAAGYSTWAGDTSLGYENSLGGILKSDVREMLSLYEQGRLCGLTAMQSLFYVNHLEPSAELRPLDNEGEYTQTDEADLMPYAQLDNIILALITNENKPWDAYQLLKRKDEQAMQHNKPALFASDEDRVLKIHKVCWLYLPSQFKRTGGGNAPFMGGNLDSHLSQETTSHSLLFVNGRVKMNLMFLDEQGILPFDEALYINALIDAELRDIIAKTTPISDIPGKINTWKQTPSSSHVCSLFNRQNKRNYDKYELDQAGSYKNSQL